jgi:hypothetical protein
VRAFFDRFIGNVSGAAVVEAGFIALVIVFVAVCAETDPSVGHVHAADLTATTR